MKSVFVATALSLSLSQSRGGGFEYYKHQPTNQSIFIYITKTQKSHLKAFYMWSRYTLCSLNSIKVLHSTSLTMCCILKACDIIHCVKYSSSYQCAYSFIPVIFLIILCNTCYKTFYIVI